MSINRNILSCVIMFFFIIITFIGCKDAYPNEKEDTVIKKDATYITPEPSVDTLVYPYSFGSVDCKIQVQQPYSLIQWNDGTYGILYHDPDDLTDHFKVGEKISHYAFTMVVEQGEHFKDSCAAKQSLKQFLDNKVTYKIVK